MYIGINEICLVCEDDVSIKVFVKDLLFFLFWGDGLYFKMVLLKNEFGGENKIVKY